MCPAFTLYRSENIPIIIIIVLFFSHFKHSKAHFFSTSETRSNMLCVKHSVEWKEQTIFMHPSGLGVAVWCPWGFLSILSLLNPTSRGPFPILVKEYVSECLLCKVYGVPFELCERLERFQRASDLPAFLKRAESELRPNTWAFHMSSVISTTLQLPFTPSFGLLILASLSVPLSFFLSCGAPPPHLFQGSHILYKAQSEFVCGAYREQCNHRGLSAVQMFRVSMLNSMPSFSVVL